MADIPSVAPPPAASGNATPPSGLSNAPVRQAPPALAAPAQPVHTAGTVVSSNPQAQQLSIETPQGTVVIQTAAALPQDTPVSVEIFAGTAGTRATVSVVRQAPEQAQTLARQATAQGLQALENAIAPPEQPPAAPPLQEGSTVTALLLPEPPAASAAPDAITPLQIAQIAASVETLKETGLQSLRPLLPEEALNELLKTADVKSFLERLPPQLLQDMAEALPSAAQAPPEGAAAPQKRQPAASAPQETGTQPAFGSASAPPAPDMLDSNLLHIMRAQLLAKTTQTSLRQASAPRNGKPGGLLPLAATLDMLSAALGEEKPSGFPALMRQFLPQDLTARLPAPQILLRVQILKILPPETTPAQIETALQKASAAQSGTETAVQGKIQLANVETATARGQPLLQTADGAHFVITTPVSVPSGSKIILTAAPMSAKDILQQLQRGLLPAAENAPSPQGETWPALQQVLQALPPAQQATAAAAQALRNTLPTPAQRLVPTALFFLAALRSGDIKNWLGEGTLDMIAKTASKGLASTLSGDFEKMSAQAKTALPGGWRAIAIPLRHEEQISRMQFYVRRQDDRAQKSPSASGAKPATRFILDMSLSRLGPLQLDGYIHKKSFDMILRTEESLPLDMRQELMKRFAAGLAQVQMQGGIAFQTRKQGWMVPAAAHTKTDA
ncbi:MAG: hypothetical protein KGQ70_03450 [Alphaproteobacteria bacterium]|nr:hypothetical protein [Alphaproteobacteria bacterium]